MDNSQIAILISIFSLLLAMLSLGWNIYRDVILKPRLKVWYGIRSLVEAGSGSNPSKDFIVLSATNHGPGKIKCDMIHYKNQTLLNTLLRKYEGGFIIHDYENPLSEKLPRSLKVGECIDLLFKINDKCALTEPMTHVGIRDSFGRVHWAPHKDVKKAIKLYKEKYINTNAGI